ncbi:hypothetical protein [Maribacter halichondriae]|uniref:hypothetical protein n=1 Tax=Maribacter halichondriae TaxID=2980554 RepID=UPI0023587998|nr:hypothetical protein [Maribacter sp. Hal144]
MKIIRLISGISILILTLSCSKEETQPEEIEEGTFLTFETKKKGNSTVLYSKWITSQFPNSSLNSSEIWNLPLIKNSYLDLEKDLILVYGRRNNIFPLPVTMPQDAESYIIEFIPVALGIIPRLRVTSLDLSGLQDIFFRPSAGAEFRVVIVPSEKLLPLKSGKMQDYQKMTYHELADYFNITE